MTQTLSETLLELAGKLKASSESKSRPPEKAEQDRKYEVAVRLAVAQVTRKPRAAANAPRDHSEVFAYATEISLPKSEAALFIDHFTSNGWKVGGKAPMKCWKAALRNWRHRWAQDNPEAAARIKREAQPATDTQPPQWREWLTSKNLPFTPYGDARSYHRAEFKTWLASRK